MMEEKKILKEWKKFSKMVEAEVKKHYYITLVRLKNKTIRFWNPELYASKEKIMQHPMLWQIDKLAMDYFCETCFASNEKYQEMSERRIRNIRKMADNDGILLEVEIMKKYYEKTSAGEM